MPTENEIQAAFYAARDEFYRQKKRSDDGLLLSIRDISFAALEAAEKVRMEVTTKQEEGLSRDFKRVKEVKTLGEAFSIAYACEIALEKSITERFTKREEKLREALSILYTDAVLVESGQRMSRNTVKDLINNAIQQPVT